MKKIQIDAGHGEVRSDTGTYDPGAVGPQGTTEASIALSIALKTGELLKKTGFEVFYTRTKDREVDSWYKINDMFYNNNIDMLISIHCNAFNGSAQGIETFYSSYSTSGRKLAELLQDNMIKTFPGHIDRGLKTQSLKVTNLSFLKPIALLECEFIDHPTQEKFLKDTGNQQKIAETIKNSVCQYYGKDSSSEGSSSLEKPERETIKATLKKYCKEYGLNYLDILAQAIIESNLNPEAISASRALGVGQIKLATAEYICKRHNLPVPQKEEELFDIDLNCKLMCLIMSDMLKKAQERHLYDTARLLYHDGEFSLEQGVNGLAGIEYNNKVVKKKKEIEIYI